MIVAKSGSFAQAEPMSLGELDDYLIAEGGHPSQLVDRLVQADYVRSRVLPTQLLQLSKRFSRFVKKRINQAYSNGDSTDYICSGSDRS